MVRGGAGRPQHAGDPSAVLDPGSYFGSSGASVHRITSSDAQDTVLYIRTNGPYDFGDAQR
ncbi:hypothetical protein Pla163_08530 [Planctomycetes bacterium Pla163]|uniref:Cysteine dioxygenase n=1 Tax=Rohdeia mirabilis TaxID=2528008 RepID=A0A518CWY7_9BACT|nr:hypothetical protein Pla163_08530 [Planctomycetes bacterium Pla163]